MKAKMRFSLKPGERIFINGAVLTFDQKVTMSLLNDARFLLESHVLQLREATTPMRQLYFVVQAILIEPSSADSALAVFRDLHAAMLETCNDEKVKGSLNAARDLVDAGRTFEALKTIRNLFETDGLQPSFVSIINSHQVA